MLCAEISLSRMATMARPTGERRMLTDSQITKISTAQRQVVDAVSHLRSAKPKIDGVGTGKPSKPPVTEVHFWKMVPTIEPKASVAIAR